MASVDIVDYHDLEPEFYQQHVHHLFYASSWLKVLSNIYGYQFQTAIDRASGQFIIFTVVEHFLGSKVISLPFSDYTEIDVQSTGAGAKLLQAIQAKYPSLPVVLKTTHAATAPVALQLGHPIRQAYYHRIDTRNMEQVDAQQSSSFKRGVRKAAKSGVTVQLRRNEEALQAFYQMYYQLRMHKFSSIPQSYAFFQQIYQVFMAQQQGFILQADHAGKAIASIIVLEHKKILYYKFGCSTEDSLALRPNNLIFDTLMQYAHQHQFMAIDLGLSGTGESYQGLVRFKESMGGNRQDITYFQSLPDGYDQSAERSFKAILSSLTEVIVQQELDIETTNRFSEILYPFFA